MVIGRLEIPDVEFSPELKRALQTYCEKTGESVSYIAECGVDHPELSEINPDLLRLLAAVRYLQQDPENGLAATNVAHAFQGLGRLDNAVAVLQSLEAIGAPGCYRNVWYEDPAFLAGWMLADAGRLHEALDCYQRAIARETLEDKGPIWAHIASVHHELCNFQEAVKGYGAAIGVFETSTFRPGNPSLSSEERRILSDAWARNRKEQVETLRQLKDTAARSCQASIRRIMQGVVVEK